MKLIPPAPQKIGNAFPIFCGAGGINFIDPVFGGIQRINLLALLAISFRKNKNKQA